MILNPLNPSIKLSSPLVNSDTFSTSISYNIKTQDNSGKYECMRLYSDFILIRKTLCKKWPGVYIPPIPNKPLLSNLSSKFVKTYKKQAERFLDYLSTQSFIYSSQELQMFLKSKTMTKSKIKTNFNEISLNYQAIFYDYTGRELTDSFKFELEKAKNFFFESLQSLVIFRDKAEELMLDFKDYHNLLGSFSDQFTKTETIFILNSDDSNVYVEPCLSNIKNYYSELFV